MGKAYANRKKKADRPKGDFSSTPVSLTRELLKKEPLLLGGSVLEPACGGGAISNEIKSKGYKISENDLFKGGKDFLDFTETYDLIITNPPFSQFDNFVMKAKELSPRVVMLGKMNFFGATKRNKKGVVCECKIPA